MVGANDYDQAGARIDFNASAKDQTFARFSWSGGFDFNPVSVRGTPVPGFPTRDDLKTDSAELSSTHLFSPSLTNSLRGTFLRYLFDFDLRLNQTPPSALGFTLPPAAAAGQGPPFFNVLGYSPIGGAITGPRDSAQNSYEVQEGPLLDPRRALREIRRRRPGHPVEYVSGHRAQFLLHLRLHLSHQRRDCQSPARRAR